jgi:hypothetical protein
MTAEIDSDGLLMIRAETPLESYALKQWCDNQMNKLPDALVIYFEPKEKKDED